MLSKFYCKSYFDLEYLKFFYKNRPKEIIDFYKKIKSKIADKSFVSVSFIEGFRELYIKFKVINKFKNKIFENLKKDIDPSISLKIFYSNEILLDQFINSNIGVSENNIRRFLIDNISKIDYIRLILSTHEFYMHSEYFKKNPPDTHPLFYALETHDFIIINFDELFSNDEAYALGIFIFLDGIVKKYGLSEKLGIFKDIYLKGKEIMEKEFSEEELKEVVNYIKKKEGEMDFV